MHKRRRHYAKHGKYEPTQPAIQPPQPPPSSTTKKDNTRRTKIQQQPVTAKKKKVSDIKDKEEDNAETLCHKEEE